MNLTTREFTISEVAEALERVPHTIRVWGYNDRLPDHLRPKRNARGWRVWTAEQVEGLKQWLIDEDMRPGKGLPNVKKPQ